MRKQITMAQDVADQDILQEIGSMGAGHASVALSTMLNEQVIVEMPRLHTKPPHLVPSIYNEHDTVVAAIFMQLRGKMDCDLMLLFEAQEAKKIGDIMAKNAAGKEHDEEMEISAIEELGSIMICTFLNAMANFTGIELVPTPLQLIYDTFDAVTDGLLARQALYSNMAAVFGACFRRSTSSAEGYLIMFPGDSIKREFAEIGKKWPEGSLAEKIPTVLSSQ